MSAPVKDSVMNITVHVSTLSRNSALLENVVTTAFLRKTDSWRSKSEKIKKDAFVVIANALNPIVNAFKLENLAIKTCVNVRIVRIPKTIVKRENTSFQDPEKI